MLKDLEKKGLLNECMMDYIQIQQEYEKQNIKHQRKELAFHESPSKSEKRLRFSHTMKV
jgi:hypothetical protein